MSKKNNIDKELMDTRSALETLDGPSEHVTTEAPKRVRPSKKFTGHEGPLSFPQIKGFKIKVARAPSSDFDFEYLKLLDEGWEPVLRKEYEPELESTDPQLANSKIMRSIGKDDKGILMKLPEEWWEEDQAAFCKENSKHVTARVYDKEQAAELARESTLKAIEGSISVNTKYGKI